MVDIFGYFLRSSQVTCPLKQIFGNEIKDHQQRDKVIHKVFS